MLLKKPKSASKSTKKTKPVKNTKSRNGKGNAKKTAVKKTAKINNKKSAVKKSSVKKNVVKKSNNTTSKIISKNNKSVKQQKPVKKSIIGKPAKVAKKHVAKGNSKPVKKSQVATGKSKVTLTSKPAINNKQAKQAPKKQISGGKNKKIVTTNITGKKPGLKSLKDSKPLTKKENPAPVKKESPSKKQTKNPAPVKPVAKEIPVKQLPKQAKAASAPVKKEAVVKQLPKKQEQPKENTTKTRQIAEPKGKFELEYVLHSSTAILFEFLVSPSGLSEWFCDDVNIRNDIYTFFWDGSQQIAKLVRIIEEKLARFEWTEKSDGTYFEFRIEKDELTNDTSLIVTDFADNDEEKKSSQLLWNSQIDKLLNVLGSNN